MLLSYIRIGEIPENEKSGIYKRKEKVGEEEGVSVYYGVLIDGRWSLVLPSPIRENKLLTLYSLEDNLARGDRAYLVKGSFIGIGSDGEPLLRDVEILDDITDHLW